MWEVHDYQGLSGKTVKNMAFSSLHTYMLHTYTLHTYTHSLHTRYIKTCHFIAAR